MTGRSGSTLPAGTLARVTDLEGTLLFAGVPLGVVALVFILVFLRSAKPSRDPVVKPVMDDDNR